MNQKLEAVNASSHNKNELAPTMAAHTATPVPRIAKVPTRVQSVTGGNRSRADAGKLRKQIASNSWCAYFRRNAESRMHIPWHRGAELTANEKRAVAGSIQKFQLGESGQGRHFLRCAQRHAARTGDNGYVTALRLFIAEENCHADALGRFLDSAGIPRLQREWSSGLFRWLRQRAGLDLIISVLITAEIIAKVYYAALRQATGSTVLRRICEQLLCDEVMHIRFQSERLAQIRQARFRWWAKLSLAAQKLFFEGACVVIWFTHLRVFRAAGFSFSQYWRKAHHEFENAARMMSPWYRQPARRVTRTWFSA